MEKLISFDLQADFGFMKKPDVNAGMQFSYNMLHKPALLGILGAIAGMGGYQHQGRFPDYYERLAGLPVSIEPLEGRHERGNFKRTLITYTNTVGYANERMNLVIQEHTLVQPGYRCYLLLDPEINSDQRLLYDRIHSGQSVYVPYLGKNEFHAWWDPACVQDHKWNTFEAKNNFRIDSLFIRKYPLRDHRQEARIDLSTMTTVNASSFAYFERLPLYFWDDPKFIQYELAEFVFTDWVFAPEVQISNLFWLEEVQKIIQLF